MARKTKNVKSKDRQRLPRSLKTIYANAAGIDLGSREHWVCGPPREDGTPNVQRFGTTTPELFRLADWLKEQGVKTVAMESPAFTGSRCSKFSTTVDWRSCW